MAKQDLPIILRSGLDYVTDPKQRDPGTMLSCLNYEVTQDQGYSLIDSPGVYDGTMKDMLEKRIWLVYGQLSGANVFPHDPYGLAATWTGHSGGPFTGRYFPIGPDTSSAGGGRQWHIIWNPTGNLDGGSGIGDEGSDTEDITVDGSRTLSVNYIAEYSSMYELLAFNQQVNEQDGDPVTNYMPVAHFNTALSYLLDSVTHYDSTFTKELPSQTNFRTGAPQHDTYFGGLFYFDNELYAVDAPTAGTGVAQVIYRADSTNGWTAIDMGQEMAFNNGIFPIRFQDYIAWDSSSRASYLLGGTSSSTELDYFPGKIAYHKDVSDNEFWGTIVWAHRGKGTFANGQFASCQVATVANIDLTDATSYQAGGTIDGYTLVATNRVLVHKQDASEENGIYVVQASGELVRSTDLDEDDEAISGWTVSVDVQTTGGIGYGGATFFLFNVDDLSVGVSGLAWLEGDLAEGAFTVYDNADRTSGGVTTTDGTTTFPLSATWTEGNALNFITGTNEPNIGDQITDGAGQTATVLRVIVDLGTWAGNNASGTLIVGAISGTGVFADEDVITNTTQAGETTCTTNNIIRDTDRDNLFTNTTVNAAVTLPTLDDLIAADSKYVSVEHNFFATDDKTNPLIAPSKAVFIANGAGLALKYDGTHLVRIRSGAATDTPRHISVHSNRLALGYADGSVSLSVEGEPLNFNGTDGALNFGYSHKITGLQVINGDTTAIFTDRTIEMLQGTNDQNMVSRLISHNSGALEYTAANMGEVIFTDRHGVNTLSAVGRYGDFAISRLSDRVRPRLLERLRLIEPGHQQTPDESLDYPLAGALDFAMAVRGKQQYRLFFKDGLVMTCTLVAAEGGGMMPVWTEQRFVNPVALNSDAGPDLMRVSGHVHTSYTVGVDENGQDALFYLHNQLSQSSRSGQTKARGPLKLDWVPGLTPFNAYMIIGPIIPDNEGHSWVKNSMMLSGQYNGYLQLRIDAVGVDQKEPYTWREAASIYPPISSQDAEWAYVTRQFLAAPHVSTTSEFGWFDVSTATGAAPVVEIGDSFNPHRPVHSYFSDNIPLDSRGQRIYLFFMPYNSTLRPTADGTHWYSIGSEGEDKVTASAMPHRLLTLTPQVTPGRRNKS